MADTLIPNARTGFKPYKFTFRKLKRETGLAGVGYPTPDTVIKVSGQMVGAIHAPNWRTKDNLFRIGLMVKDEGIAGFKWLFFKARFQTEPEAREWLKKFSLVIAKSYDLHAMEDYQ